jgi:hypothetical protein
MPNRQTSAYSRTKDSSDLRRAFDFDRKQAVFPFYDEVDLLARGGPPVGHVRPWYLALAPAEELAEHEGLAESRPQSIQRVPIHPSQKSRQGCVRPIQLGRLDQPLRAVDGVRRQSMNLVRDLQQVQVPMRSRRGESSIAGELGLVEQRRAAQGGDAHEAAEVDQRVDLRELLKIALEIRTHVSIEPESPILFRAANDRWIPTPQQGVVDVEWLQRLAPHEICGGLRTGRSYQLAPRRRSRTAVHFGVRHRQQGQVLGATGKGL